MSLWKFGNFETEIDFTDADFLDRLDEAKRNMNLQLNKAPKTGKASDIVRAQCACFYAFFDTLFGRGAGDKIFEGKNSLERCFEAAEALNRFEQESVERFEQFGKYQVQNHGNRQQSYGNWQQSSGNQQQRRQYEKQNGKKQNKYYGNKKG